MFKHRMRFIGMGVMILILILSMVSLSGLTTHASASLSAGARRPAAVVRTIQGLHQLSVVGSTQLIVDATGHTASEDANPYGVAIVPLTPTTRGGGKVKAGDLVVTNIGNTDTGNTLVVFPQQAGPGHLFNTIPNAGTSGPADEAFNSATGTDWVANVSANDVQIFNPSGTLLKQLTSPLFNHPWGMASNHNQPNPVDHATGSFFVTNVKDATIDRIDIVPTAKGVTFPVFQIGQLPMAGTETKIGVTWLPALTIAGKRLTDVLLAIDPGENRIAAYPNSTTANTTATRSSSKGITVFQGKPLARPGGFALNPLNGDLLVVNLDENTLVELNMSASTVVGTKLLDNVPDDRQTGNGSALFDVAATADARGNLEVFFTEDNTNTLDRLSL